MSSEVVLECEPMLEGILLTAVLVYVFSYTAVKIIGWLFDRPQTPGQRQELIQEQMSKLEREP